MPSVTKTWCSKRLIIAIPNPEGILPQTDNTIPNTVWCYKRLISTNPQWGYLSSQMPSGNQVFFDIRSTSDWKGWISDRLVNLVGGWGTTPSSQCQPVYYGWEVWSLSKLDMRSRGTTSLVGPSMCVDPLGNDLRMIIPEPGIRPPTGYLCTLLNQGIDAI